MRRHRRLTVVESAYSVLDLDGRLAIRCHALQCIITSNNNNKASINAFYPGTSTARSFGSTPASALPTSDACEAAGQAPPLSTASPRKPPHKFSHKEYTKRESIRPSPSNCLLHCSRYLLGSPSPRDSFPDDVGHIVGLSSEVFPDQQS